MDFEQTMLIILAKTMPEDMLIAKLSEAIEDYKKDKTTDNKAKLLMHAMLLTMGMGTEGHSAENIMKDIDRHKEAKDLYDRLTTDETPGNDENKS